MITVQINGGLGNQMFQYAFGKTMAIKVGRDFCIDTRMLRPNRPYALGCFQIRPKILKYTLAYRILRYLKKKNIVEEKFQEDIDYAGKVWDKKDITLVGYWMGENYFKDIEPEIRRDFTFRKNISIGQKNIQIKDLINKTNSVSIHIRRGDYISDPASNSVHGVCSLDYYGKAISCIKDKVKNPSYFIFSDDVKWVKRNLKIKSPHYFVEGNSGTRSYIDMYLMSQCKHNIIANSSFSWWGAWLNENTNKIVIAPKKWFNNKDAQKNAKNVVPTKWLKI